MCVKRYLTLAVGYAPTARVRDPEGEADATKEAN